MMRVAGEDKPKTPRSALQYMPVTAFMSLALAVGLAASLALSIHSVGGEALQLAGVGIRAPAKFLWFFRDRLNARFGSFTGLSAVWFWISWDLFGQPPTSKVAIGSDGWMFLRGGESEDVRGLLPWAEGEEARWLHRFDQWCEAAQSKGLPLVIAVAPNKSSVLSDRLGIDDVAPFEQTRYGGMLQKRGQWPSRLQAAWLDLHGVIEACDPELSYFRTDTHWNYRGADCAAEAIATRLGDVEGTRSEAPWVSSRDVEADGGDLARMLGAARRFRERMELPDRISRIGSIEDLQQVPPPPSLQRSPAMLRVLVVHDSFGMILRDPLSARLPGSVYERGTPATMTAAELSRLIDRESPEAIVIVFVERRLTEAP